MICCGSRNWRDPNVPRKVIENRLFDLCFEFPGEMITIVEGEARGADRIWRQEAEKAGYLIDPHPAEWDKHDREGPVPCNCRPDSDYCPRAGHRRNEKMATLGADLCIALWDGRSTGTQDMLDRARAHGIPVETLSVSPSIHTSPDERRVP